MNVVAINTETREIFQSQIYSTEDEKNRIQTSIMSDADLGEINIEIKYLSHNELRKLI